MRIFVPGVVVKQRERIISRYNRIALSSFGNQFLVCWEMHRTSVLQLLHYGFVERSAPWTYSMVFTALKVWNDILGKSNKDLLYCEFSQFKKIIFQKFFSKFKNSNLTD